MAEPLSPAAQAVLDAVADRYSQLATMSTAVAAAAALRAAADQVDWNWEPCEQLLSIANELDPK
jgi:hypothetical protein